MKLVKSFALILFITFLVVSFQSCTVKQNTGLLGSKTSSQSQVDAVLEAAPFAFDYVPDTISYNSCVGPDLPESVHGFKIGSNQGFIDSTVESGLQGGAKLRTDFLQYIAKNVTPSYPSTVIVPAQIQNILQNSPKNTDSFIQYAIRNKSDLNVLINTINPVAAAALERDGMMEKTGLHFGAALTQLTEGIVFGPNATILKEGPRLNTLKEKTVQAQPIQGNLKYNMSTDATFPSEAGKDDGLAVGEQYSDIVRKKFNSSSTDKVILAITYGDPNSIASTKSPDRGLNNPKRAEKTDVGHAFGRGFELKFQSASNLTGWRDNRLTEVKEYTLAKNDTISVSTWSCENFVIMKQNQWNNNRPTDASCAPLTSSDLQDSTFSAQVRKLRRHYSEADWDIGVFYGKGATYVPSARSGHGLCVVPKKAECYLPTTGITTDGTDMGVQYDTSQECYLSAFMRLGISYTGALTGDAARKLGRCAQYASVCVRL